MRTHHCLTALLCGAFLLGAGMAHAQTPPGTAGYAQFPSHAAIDASQAPMGYTYPYPAISPFDNAFESTYQDRGLWVTEREKNFNDRVTFGIDWIFGEVAQPKSDPVSYDEGVIPQQYFRDGVFATSGLVVEIGGEFFGDLITPASQQDVLNFQGGQGPYAPFDSGLLDGTPVSGVQLNLLIERSDGIGLQLNGFGMWPGTNATETGYPIVQYGPEDPNDALQIVTIYEQDFVPGIQRYHATGGFDNNIQTNIVDLDTVGAFNPGIRLYDGSSIGTIQRFDAYFRTEWYTNLYGAGATILHNASRQIGPFVVRPVMGVRYIHTKEKFRLQGHDSYSEYAVGFDQASLTDPTARFSLYPGGAELAGVINFGEPIRAYMDSTTETDLAGPEFGWQYAAGGDYFQLTGDTRIGVMGGRQRGLLITKGIGQPILMRDTAIGDVNEFYNPNLVTEDSDSTSYVTPTFQQTFNTTTQPFAYVPFLRSYRCFREANLKAGWTFLLIGQLQRPNEQIVYQSGNGAIPPDRDDEFVTPSGDPDLIPEVKKDRSLFFVNYFNLGVEWNY